MARGTEFVMDDYFNEFESGEEKQMKRSISSMIGILTFCGIALSASSAMADNKDGNVTVSFGQWDPDLSAPLDRLLGDPAGGVGVNDKLIPDNVTIKAGDAVNFIISGGHVVTVYEDGTQPADIGGAIEPNCAFPLPASGLTIPCSPVNMAGVPMAGGILSDSEGRIYRGAFLNLARRDGVEVVQFTKPGTYLVICARKNHFLNPTTQQFEMFGFVEVKKAK
jgi:plastocyanin